jgi:hypothetical protein
LLLIVCFVLVRAGVGDASMARDSDLGVVDVADRIGLNAIAGTAWIELRRAVRCVLFCAALWRA